jgi:hypothetical protein
MPENVWIWAMIMFEGMGEMLCEVLCDPSSRLPAVAGGKACIRSLTFPDKRKVSKKVMLPNGEPGVSIEEELDFAPWILSSYAVVKTTTPVYVPADRILLFAEATPAAVECAREALTPESLKKKIVTSVSKKDIDQIAAQRDRAERLLRIGRDGNGR